MRALVHTIALLVAAMPAGAHAAGDGGPQGDAAAPGVYTYRVKGSPVVRPSAIADDGVRTYIEWHADQPLPATFAIGDDGREQAVDGYVRDGVFTIDEVYSRLVFRKDRLLAEARRNAGAGR